MLNRRSLFPAALAAVAAEGALVASCQASGRSVRPDLAGADSWLNIDRPLTIEALRGKVVLIEFCTYTCINWRRTLRYVRRWHAEYAPLGLQVIGVHTPEFGFEHVRNYVESALRDLDVTFPIAQDNEYRTWRAWDNRAWPSFYLLDKDGRVRLIREGEGHSQEVEAAIRNLLGLAHRESRQSPLEDADLSGIRTPEMYFGSLHGTPQDRTQSPRDGEASYVVAHANGPGMNEYNLEGAWARGDEPLALRSGAGRLRLRFSAAKLHLVAGAPEPTPVHDWIDGHPGRTVEIGRPTLYTLLDGDIYGEHLLELGCEAPGLPLYSATFG